MSDVAPRADQEFVRQIAEQYLQQGYRVLSETKALPESLRRHGEIRYDLVAEKEGQLVFVEIKSADRPADDHQADQQLASLIASLPGARWDVVWVPRRQAPSLEQVEALALLAQAHAIVKASPAAALLLCWTIVERALQTLADRPDTQALDAAEELYAAGRLSERQWQVISAAAPVRDAVAHARKPPGGSIDITVSSLLDVADTLADTVAYERATILSDWFFERYENAVHHVPYDSEEGGFQYVGGGPTDPEQVLGLAFPDEPGEVIGRAVSLISDYGTEWVPVAEDEEFS